MKGKKFAITLPEYQRLCNVIRSVDHTVNQRPAPSCLFVNTIGAFVLQRALGIDAMPRMGEALIHTGGDQKICLTFADFEGSPELPSSDSGRFHCWIETQDHLIDLTAPFYREYLAGIEASASIPRKMFQKRKDAMAVTPDQVKGAGDFFFEVDLLRTQRDLQRLMESRGTRDLANACLNWFVRPPKPMKPAPMLMDDLGVLIRVVESKLVISEAW